MLSPNERSLANQRLSNNFTLFEFINSLSRPDLVEYPSEHLISLMRMHCEDILQPIRDKFGRVRINSGYRNPKLNAAVGGVRNSIHMIYVNNRYAGTATDIVTLAEPDLVKVMHFIKHNVPEVRRMILYRSSSPIGIENSFLHVDRMISVPKSESPILMEKISRSAYTISD